MKKVRCKIQPQNDWDNNRKILPCRLFCINICCNNYAAMVEAQVVIDLPLLFFVHPSSPLFCVMFFFYFFVIILPASFLHVCFFFFSALCSSYVIRKEPLAHLLFFFFNYVATAS